jgi:antitoxin (DNA-binding transcriptional repressor) of toxin-antitoxin stability system
VITSTISATKNRLSELLDRVQSGETLIILDRKTPVARVERIRHASNNPHIQLPKGAWNPQRILKLPIRSGRRGAQGLAEAVREERADAW